MPLYEYECSACGQCFEQLRGLAERDDELECPKCGKKSARRRMSTFSSAGRTTSSLGSASCGTGGFT